MANTKITSRVLADNAVLTANITDANVTTAKIAADAITGAKIADDVALGGNPTTTTQSAGNNTTRVATTAFVSTAVSNLVDSSPSALNTLNELAAALGDDANFSTTVTNSIAAKLPLAGGTMTGNLAMGSNNITSSGTITGTLATAAQTNITSLGTLTALTGGTGDLIWDTNTLVVDSSANKVGIGDTTPAALFTVKGSADSYAGGLRLEGFNETTALGIVHVDGDNFFSGNATDNHLVLTSGGNLGLGATSPEGKFEIEDGGTSKDILQKITLDNDDVYGLVVGNDSYSTTLADGFAVTVSNAGVVGLQARGTSSQLQFRTANHERMRIDASGRLLVGGLTANAAHQNFDDLQVGNGSGSRGIAIYSGTSEYGSVSFADGNSGTAQYSGLIEYLHTDNSMRLYTANTERVRIKSDGTVGIGTTNPIRMLDIKGSGDPGIRLESASYSMDVITLRNNDGRVGFGGDAITVRADGRVGVATIPSEIFHIYSPAESYWALKVDCVNSAYGIQTVGQGNFAIGILNSSSNTYRGRWDHNGTLYTQDGNVHDVDSDERLKEDITDCPSQWSLIKDLPLQRFKWKDKRNGDTFSYGWVAQPTKAKYPEFVEPIPQPKEDIDEGKDDPEYLTVRSGDIQKRSIAALQEAMTRIEALEAEVAALKG